MVMFDGKIFDRAVDDDLDIMRNSEMVSQIHMRKRAEYSERMVFPHAKEKDFDFERLMPKVRRLAAGRNEEPPITSPMRFAGARILIVMMTACW